MLAFLFHQLSMLLSQGSRPWSSLSTIHISPWAICTMSINTTYSCWLLHLHPLLSPLPEFQASKSNLQRTSLLQEAIKNKLCLIQSLTSTVFPYQSEMNRPSCFLHVPHPPPVQPPRQVCSHLPLFTLMGTILVQASITSALPCFPSWPLLHHPERSFKNINQIRPFPLFNLSIAPHCTLGNISVLPP